MLKQNGARAGVTHVSVFLFLSALVFGILAHYQFTAARNEQRAALLAGIAGIQWIVGLSQRDIRQWLMCLGRDANELEAFTWSRGRRLWTIVGVLWMGLTFWLSWDAMFTCELMVCWVLGIIYWWMLLSEHGQRAVRLPCLTIALNAELLLFAASLGVGAFFLYYRLDEAPAGMIADHAEKIFDLIRIEQGSYPIYFGANSGREPFHFYASYIAVQFFGYSFLSLKHVSALTALLTLPALYYLGRQVDGRLTGLLAMALGAVSIWFMIMGRSGFRAFSAAFAAAILLGAFWQALHSGKRRDFLLAGLVLGLGMYGYTSFRIAPLVIAGGLALRLMLLDTREQRRRLLWNFLALTGLALMVYIPLLAYWARFPGIYWYRSQQMVGSNMGDNLRLYVEGLVKSLTMINVTTDPVGLNVVPGWGAVGPVVGALWLVGLVLWLWRMVQNRRVIEFLLPLAFLIFMLPSAMAISAPNEMPSARRALDAFPVVMVLGAVSLSSVLRLLYSLKPGWIWRPLSMVFCAGVLYTHASVNWDAYFNLFTAINNFSTQGQIEVTNVIKHFERMGGSRWDAYIIFEGDYIWIDPRMVAMGLNEATTWDNVVVDNSGRDICGLGRRSEGRPVMYIYSLFAEKIEQGLKLCFPDHVRYIYHDQVDGEMFRVFIVPGESEEQDYDWGIAFQ